VLLLDILQYIDQRLLLFLFFIISIRSLIVSVVGGGYQLMGWYCKCRAA
jgi:hypothetical protein